MELKLYKNFPINSYEHQVYYSNPAERDADFDKYTDKHFTDLASCDKSAQLIRLNMNYYHGNMYNYGCLIENNKRYYIFIDRVEWKSNLNTVVLHYSYDYFQTYCYDINIQQSYVEREHVENDAFGKHIIDEGLPIDEYKVQSSKVLDGDSDGLYFCVSCSDCSQVVSASANGQVEIGGTCKPSKYEQSTMIIFSDNLENINWYLSKMVLEAKTDAIQGLYAVPKCAISDKVEGLIQKGYEWDTGESDINYIGKNNNDAVMQEWTIRRPTDIDGYTPVNNKCFTYPYCFINVTNNNGNSVKAQFELSDDNSTITFNYYFSCIEGNASFGYFKNYDGVVKNFDYSIQGQTNIELPFVTNTFSAYMSANQNSIANQYKTIDRNEKWGNIQAGVSGGISAVSSLAMGNVAGALTSVVGAESGMISNMLQADNARNSINASLADMQNRPDTAHGSYTGNAPTICGQIGFKGQLITVTAENIEMIDHYFSMYGYRVNKIKQPQFTSRKYWNYIKTCGINIIANIPQDALAVIKSMFNNGVTIWHNVSYMYKYGTYEKENKAQ